MALSHSLSSLFQCPVSSVYLIIRVSVSTGEHQNDVTSFVRWRFGPSGSGHRQVRLRKRVIERSCRVVFIDNFPFHVNLDSEM